MAYKNLAFLATVRPYSIEAQLSPGYGIPVFQPCLSRKNSGIDGPCLVGHMAWYFCVFVECGPMRFEYVSGFGPISHSRLPSLSLGCQ